MIFLTMESLKLFLVSEMEKRGWSQAELSRRTGIDSGWISNLMSGNRSLGFTSLVGLAKGLKVSTDYILRETGHLPKLSFEEAHKEELICLYLQMNEETRKDLLFYARFALEKQSDG